MHMSAPGQARKCTHYGAGRLWVQLSSMVAMLMVLDIFGPNYLLSVHFGDVLRMVAMLSFSHPPN